MTALFLACAILLAFTSGIGEKNFMDQFIGGAADLMGVALVVGVARGINIILEDGMISDTILEFFSGAISGMNPIVFIILIESSNISSLVCPGRRLFPAAITTICASAQSE